MSERLPAACAEFPNDNPALHSGAIWCCEALTAAATWVKALAVVEEPPCVEEPTHAISEPTPTIPDAPPEMTFESSSTPFETESVESTEPVESVESEAGELYIDLAVELGLDADPGEPQIEVVDELVFDEVIDESPAAPVVPAPEEDPFATLVRIVEEVAVGASASPEALAALRAVLGKTRLDGEAPATIKDRRSQAAAWQAILSGESEDFSACGSSALDEWCSDLVAHVLDAPTRADSLRRELRQRGVAAFGIVADAA